MRAALAALLIASTAAADSPAPAILTPDGGCHLSAERCVLVGQELARLRAENAEFKKPGPSPVVVVLVAIVAGALGFAAAKAGK